MSPHGAIFKEKDQRKTKETGYTLIQGSDESHLPTGSVPSHESVSNFFDGQKANCLYCL